MGSTFITLEPSSVDNSGLFKNAPPQLVWLQFVPGHVEKIYTEPSTMSGVIEASAHASDNSVSKTTTKYLPLLRGINETPSKGDPVLLCTFGQRNYYLGPLNSENNVNFNMDGLYESESEEAVGEAGRDLSFPFQPNRSKSTKPSNVILDNSTPPSHGDIMIEGRHGNSLRVGSRGSSPYIVFSNGQSIDSSFESAADGTLLTALQEGSIKDNFGGYVAQDTDTTVNGFMLASDTINEPNRIMSSLIQTSIGTDDVTDYIYNYSRPQLFGSSDRIVFNAKKESIFISSKINLNMGAGKDVTVSANSKILLEASNIYLGKQEEAHAVAFADNISEVITELIDIVSSAVGTCTGAPIPLLENPAIGNGGPIGLKLASLKAKFAPGGQLDFQSSKHFVEKNQ
tara:strand:+ start:14798 stop:15994 length:1197 start_codon:yes stop_codon:yes gene_type:complete